MIPRGASLQGVTLRGVFQGSNITMNCQLYPKFWNIIARLHVQQPFAVANASIGNDDSLIHSTFCSLYPGVEKR